MDGPTDSAVEQELVYIRYAVQGTIRTKFLGIQDVEKGDAENVTKALSKVVNDNLNIEISQLYPTLVGFASDGAAVMTGRRSGVATRLKKHQPAMISVHCCAHKLELAYKQSMEKEAIYDTLHNLLINLYYFYHNSPLNRSNLKASFSAVGKTCLIPSRVGGTRWLPHTLRALNNLWNGYSGLILHLNQVGVQMN